MKRMLFVCQANVGRSQMAEAFYNFQTDTRNASSAGVEDFREKYSHRPTAEIVTTMLEKGIDISNQKIDYLNQEMIHRADVVVVLCSKRLCPTFLADSLKTIYREVEDPHQLDENSIRRIRDQIENIVSQLVAEHFSADKDEGKT